MMEPDERQGGGASAKGLVARLRGWLVRGGAGSDEEDEEQQEDQEERPQREELGERAKKRQPLLQQLQQQPQLPQQRTPPLRAPAGPQQPVASSAPATSAERLRAAGAACARRSRAQVERVLEAVSAVRLEERSPKVLAWAAQSVDRQPASLKLAVLSMIVTCVLLSLLGGRVSSAPAPGSWEALVLEHSLRESAAPSGAGGMMELEPSGLSSLHVSGASFVLGELAHWEPRGWLWSARHGAARQGAGTEARSAAPFAVPALDDPGHEYLPFLRERVSPEWAGSPLLTYDVNVLRLADQFGLINDGLPLEELRAAMQIVVDTFAKVNVHLRVSTADLAQVHPLSSDRALIYLAYVEGPDLAEQVDVNKPVASRVGVNASAARSSYVAWFREAMREHFPVASAELLMRGSKAALTSEAATGEKEHFKDQLLHWAVGAPLLLSPWDLAHTSTVLPAYYYHGEEGAGSAGGIVVARTGSCDPAVRPARWLERRWAVECKGFAASLARRFQDGPVLGALDRKPPSTQLLARTVAHALGHTMGLAHPPGAGKRKEDCRVFGSWGEAPLMQAPKLLAVRDAAAGGELVGCTPAAKADAKAGAPAQPQREAQDLAASAFERALEIPRDQAQRLRSFITYRDVRPSFPAKGARTVGDSTMQVGLQSPYLYDRLSHGGATMRALLGSGKRAISSAPNCPAHRLVVLNRLPAHADGELVRLRWLPSRWPDAAPAASGKKSSDMAGSGSGSGSGNGSGSGSGTDDLGTKYLVMIVRAFRALGSDRVEFDVVAATEIAVNSLPGRQRMHVEVDLPAPLRMAKGDMIAIAAVADGGRVAIDSRLFASDKALYSDVAGQLLHSSSTVFDPLMRFEKTSTIYPRVALAPRRHDAFFFADRYEPGATRVTASKPDLLRPDTWCSELILNYDLRESM